MTKNTSSKAFYKKKQSDAQKKYTYNKDQPPQSVSRPKKKNAEHKKTLELHPYLKKLKEASSKKLDMLYGLHATKAALKNPHREIEAVIINPKAQGKLKELYLKLSQSAPHEFDLIEMERPYFDLLVDKDAVHQGIVMFAQPLARWDIEDLYDRPSALIMMLDQPTDPRNIGAILRSCAAFGADALIISDKHSAESTPLLAKAAAGAMEYLPIIRVNNLKNAIEKLKDNGFWFIGLDGHTESLIYDVKAASKTIIVMGSEGSGLRRLTRESCDFLVKIPMEEKIESLNMSVAASIALYEMRKKNKIQ